MTLHTTRRYYFGDGKQCVLDPVNQTFTMRGEQVRLDEMEFRLLTYFVKHHGELVKYPDISRHVLDRPSHLPAADNHIHKCVSRLKKALPSEIRSYIVSKRRQGYRLTARVEHEGPPILAIIPIGVPVGAADAEGKVHDLMAALIALVERRIQRVTAVTVLSQDTVQSGSSWLGRPKPQMLPPKTPAHPRIIARELAADALLVLEYIEKRSCIAASITSASIDSEVERHEFDIRGTPAIDDMAAQLLRALSGALAGGSPVTSVTHRSQALEAWARALLALGHFRRAIELDHTLDVAWSGLATALALNSFGSQYAAPAATMDEARKAAKRAIDIDSLNAEAHAAAGLVSHAYDWDAAAAAASFGEALRANPQSATAHQWYANFLAETWGDSRVDEALHHVRRAVEADGESKIVNVTESRVLYFARQFDRGVSRARASLAKDTTFFKAMAFLGHSLALSGRLKESVASFRRAAVATHHRHPVILAELAWALGLARQNADAREALVAVKRLADGGHYISPFAIGRAHVGMREFQKATDRFKEAIAERSCWMPSMKTDPAFEAYRAKCKEWPAVLRAIRPRAAGGGR